MDFGMNELRSAVTLASFAIFIGLMAWVWRPARRAELDAAALLPFTGEAGPGSSAPASAKANATVTATTTAHGAADE
jgi:cytochrome c oxidase cbb3-type subunit IV